MFSMGVPVVMGGRLPMVCLATTAVFAHRYPRFNGVAPNLRTEQNLARRLRRCKTSNENGGFYVVRVWLDPKQLTVAMVSILVCSEQRPTHMLDIDRRRIFDSLQSGTHGGVDAFN
jgi:hypothetical protein